MFNFFSFAFYNINFWFKSSKICPKILDFSQISHSRGNTEAHDLSLSEVSSYCADNASVNYGQRNSVFQKLKSAKPDIFAANCHAHHLHNTTKYAAAKLCIDVENVVLKIYSHFCISAKRTLTPKEFCEFVDADECNILCHIVTRWLSLLLAIERVLQGWRAIFKPWEKIIALLYC